MVWSLLTQNDFQKTNTGEKDLKEVIDELIINIPQAEVIALIYENKKDNTKCIIKTTKNINALDLGKKYEAIGNRNFAEFNLKKNISDAEANIIQNINLEINKLPN